MLLTTRPCLLNHSRITSCNSYTIHFCFFGLAITANELSSRYRLVINSIFSRISTNLYWYCICQPETIPFCASHLQQFGCLDKKNKVYHKYSQPVRMFIILTFCNSYSSFNQTICRFFVKNMSLRLFSCFTLSSQNPKVCTTS